jgi:hypothetical protein
MAKGGRRYPLVIYTRMMNRWAPVFLVLGVALLGISWAVFALGMEQWRWLGMASVGAVNLFAGILMLLLRNGAYVQPFKDHLRLATPFLRLNVSYKRIRRTAPATMASLFPSKSVSATQADIIQPLAKMTAVVVELSAYPMSRSVLRMFLSPLFFKDKSPHFVILVNDWMRFSTELESMRSGGDAPGRVKRDSSILSRLPRK